MKYKVGDKVRIKSLDWYNENKNQLGIVCCSNKPYTEEMCFFCGKILTIQSLSLDYYIMEEDNLGYAFTDEMIEGLVEEETLIERVDDNGLPFNEWLSYKGAFHVPEGYIFKDENGNVINTTKIVLEKKKKEYPKTYEECYKIMGVKLSDCYIQGYKSPLLEDLQELLICRDAYWKIAGEEMGLGKPWEPDYRYKDTWYSIYYNGFGIIQANTFEAHTFIFPTEEMRDVFYENFKKEIEQCKELL